MSTTRRVVALVAICAVGAILIAPLAGCNKDTPQPKKTAQKPAGAAKAKVVNVICPVMKNKIDPVNIPDNLIREWKGKKVGFCCADCPEKWEALSDQEKEAKLAAAMPK